MEQKTISEIRSFNRYYTNIIGLLDRHILNSPFSLPEARILYELHHGEGIKASGIIESLGIDKGYLSRILDHFANRKLIVRRRSQADGRQMHIYLTEKGRAAFKELDRASNEQLRQLLNGLTATEGEKLGRTMKDIMQLLTKAQDRGSSERSGTVPGAETDLGSVTDPGTVTDPGSNATPVVTIRTDMRPGDLGYVIHLHGRLYKEEQNFGIGFEAYVAQGLAEFYKQYDSQKDRVWICEQKDKMVGFLALMHRGEQTAQLRYFLLLPECRGLGMGKQLMECFMSCLRERDYRHCYLWTTSEQATAIALYRRYGFVLTEEKASSTFGKQLDEQKYELSLQASL
ncbi:MAG: MarR family transcriptional regulator [Bacteroidetes bacterium]|nr:MarR family transcriptional regulator [Bacteroidota bacterium]